MVQRTCDARTPLYGTRTSTQKQLKRTSCSSQWDQTQTPSNPPPPPPNEFSSFGGATVKPWNTRRLGFKVANSNLPQTFFIDIYHAHLKLTSALMRISTFSPVLTWSTPTLLILLCVAVGRASEHSERTENIPLTSWPTTPVSAVDSAAWTNVEFSKYMLDTAKKRHRYDNK